MREKLGVCVSDKRQTEALREKAKQHSGSSSTIKRNTHQGHK